MRPPRLVLASASPRRRALLGELGFDFVVRPTAIPEEPLPGEGPEEHASRLAREKARAGAERDRTACILAADTVVAIEEHILGKPRDVAEAVAMLRRLAGREHRVITAVAVWVPDGRLLERLETSSVRFRSLSEREIEEYVRSGEPMDKAGAYAIQGGAGAFVEHREGSYSNVVGLPISAVRALLEEARVPAGAGKADDAG